MGSAPHLFHRRRATGPSYWGPGGLCTWLVTGAESAGAYFAMVTTVPPGGGPPLHLHRNEDETFYVLEGTPTFRLAGDRVVGIPGDFVNVPRGTVHGFRNNSLEPVRIISTFTPAGIEGFFEETLERAQDAGRSRPDDLRAVRARYAEAAARYGLELFPEP